jgi:hypothetical protein
VARHECDYDTGVGYTQAGSMYADIQTNACFLNVDQDHSVYVHNFRLRHARIVA